MCKTFYLSIDGEYSYKLLTKDEAHFKRLIWDVCMKALYPKGVIHQYGEPLPITIREPKQMTENHTYYVHGSYTITDVWQMINNMWEYIKCKC